MDLEERLSLVTREPTEEIVTKDELSNLFLNVSVPKHYIGIEISGLLHLGSLILTGFKINDFMRAGVDLPSFSLIGIHISTTSSEGTGVR